jgi:hypothetical protein
MDEVKPTWFNAFPSYSPSNRDPTVFFPDAYRNPPTTQSADRIALILSTARSPDK